MPAFVKGGAPLTPFGKNVYLRSAKVNPLLESYTCAAASVPARTVDTHPGQKVLQPGTVMAKITSGPDAGKVGPFQAGATDGRADTDGIVGINDTFLPWQLIEHDTEIACAYDASVVQGWCIELDAAGNPIPLSNATADAILGLKGLAITFH